MTYNLFLDDIRIPIDTFNYTKNDVYSKLDWIVVRNYNEFVKAIEIHGMPDIISFDHDLADEHYDPDLYGSETYNEVYDNFKSKTGYDCAKWLIENSIDNDQPLPETIFIHSMNPHGSMNIESLFTTYSKTFRDDLRVYRYL